MAALRELPFTKPRVHDDRRKHPRAPASLRYTRLRKEIEPPDAPFLALIFANLAAMTRGIKARAASLLGRLRPPIRAQKAPGD